MPCKFFSAWLWLQFLLYFFYQGYFFRKRRFICQVDAIFFYSVDVKMWEVWPVFHHNSPCKTQHNVVWVEFIIRLVFQPIFMAVPIRKWSLHPVELFMWHFLQMTLWHVVFSWQFVVFCLRPRKGGRGRFSTNQTTVESPLVDTPPIPPGITHSVVIQWMSYQNEKVRADRNDHGTTTEWVGNCTM